MRDPILATYKGPELHLTVKGGLHKLRSNAKPYFTITGDGYDIVQHKGKPRRAGEFSGCCHEIIFCHFPQFADLIALHLSDIDGMGRRRADQAWHVPH